MTPTTSTGNVVEEDAVTFIAKIGELFELKGRLIKPSDRHSRANVQLCDLLKGRGRC